MEVPISTLDDEAGLSSRSIWSRYWLSRTNTSIRENELSQDIGRMARLQSGGDGYGIGLRGWVSLVSHCNLIAEC